MFNKASDIAIALLSIIFDLFVVVVVLQESYLNILKSLVRIQLSFTNDNS